MYLVYLTEPFRNLLAPKCFTFYQIDMSLTSFPVVSIVSSFASALSLPFFFGDFDFPILSALGDLSR